MRRAELKCKRLLRWYSFAHRHWNPHVFYSFRIPLAIHMVSAPHPMPSVQLFMDHVMIKAEGIGPELPPGHPAEGRCLYLPRFDARDPSCPDRGHGFGVQIYQSPAAGRRSFSPQ